MASMYTFLLEKALVTYIVSEVPLTETYIKKIEKITQ